MTTFVYPINTHVSEFDLCKYGFSYGTIPDLGGIEMSDYTV